jgi:Rrf2 family transcriptional regulator, cysteine metabolism repressor
MRLTSRSEYALLVLLALARCKNGCMGAQVIAQRQAIPASSLEEILLVLEHARYLQNAKEPGGGYRLAKSADRISLAEVIRLFDGALAPTESINKYLYESTSLEHEKKLLHEFRDIRDYVARKLEKTTLADVR